MTKYYYRIVARTTRARCSASGARSTRAGSRSASRSRRARTRSRRATRRPRCPARSPAPATPAARSSCRPTVAVHGRLPERHQRAGHQRARASFSFPILSVAVNTQYRVQMPERPGDREPDRHVGVKPLRERRRSTSSASSAASASASPARSSPTPPDQQIAIQKKRNGSVGDRRRHVDPQQRPVREEHQDPARRHLPRVDRLGPRASTPRTSAGVQDPQVVPLARGTGRERRLDLRLRRAAGSRATRAKPSTRRRAPPRSARRRRAAQASRPARAGRGPPASASTRDRLARPRERRRLGRRLTAPRPPAPTRARHGQLTARDRAPKRNVSRSPAGVRSRCRAGPRRADARAPRAAAPAGGRPARPAGAGGVVNGSQRSAPAAQPRARSAPSPTRAGRRARAGAPGGPPVALARRSAARSSANA